MALTQEQINAVRVISALAEIIAVNTDPQFGYGAETLDLVRDHLKGWEWTNLHELRQTMDRLLVGLPGRDKLFKDVTRSSYQEIK